MDLMSVRNLSKESGMPEAAIRRNLSVIPHYKIGRRVMVDWEDFDRWIRQFRVVAANDPIVMKLLKGIA